MGRRTSMDRLGGTGGGTGVSPVLRPKHGQDARATRRNRRVGPWAVAWLLACALPAARAQGPIVLRDVTAPSGIAFRHTDGGSGRHYIVETIASGLATFDGDNDGLVDLYFLNGRPLRGTPAGVAPRNALYRNAGGFRFVDVTGKAGVGEAGYGLGVCAADYDNDGWLDLYVNNFGTNVLYRNRGDGTFADVTSAAGVARGHAVGAGANFLDFDGDGNLDLFAASYIGFTYENHVTTVVRGAAWYAGPRDFPRRPNHLFHNRGDGTFADVTAGSGIGAHRGAGMGTLCFDYDDDGDTDVFVCNDQALNFLFRNDGGGKFTEAALEAGVACNYAGEPVGSMGADCADYDHDGRLDFFMTDFQRQKPILYRNLGHGLFEDATMRAGAAVRSFPYVKWGCAFADFDNDGHPDLFIGCGHLGEDLDPSADRTSYMVAPIVLRNTGRGTFEDVSDAIGDAARIKLIARGVACEDLDNDGRIDVVVLNLRRPPTLLRNESVTANHWLQVRLRGVKTNRDGVGARVRVIAGSLAQLAEVHSGRGYQSHFGNRLHFGLGKHDRVDRIEVRWIGGGVDVFENLPADRLLTLTEGSSGRGDTPK